MLSLIQIITQVMLLKGKVNYIDIGVQTILAFVYGYLTNFSVWLIRDIFFEELILKIGVKSSIFS